MGKFVATIQYNFIEGFEVPTKNEKEAYKLAEKMKAERPFPATERFSSHILFVEYLPSPEEEREMQLANIEEEYDHSRECDQCGKHPPTNWDSEKCAWGNIPEYSCDGLLIEVED